jgi:hypothetical protein
MADARPARNKGGNPRVAEPKNVTSELIPSNPLSARKAFVQVALLLGIPLVVLLLARFLLRQFFPSLGY